MRAYIILGWLLVGCVHDALVPCGDLLCPASTTCMAGACVTAEQLEACAGVADGDRCATPTASGTCLGGVCVASVCGDGIVAVDEACDDGNQLDRDGCSATCASTETCGNGVVDYLVGEECDDGTPGLTGDGCSSACTVEVELWRDVSPAGIPPRGAAAMAYDKVRQRLVVFGGTPGTGTLGDTWEWNGTTWFEKTPAVAPVARVFPGMVYDDAQARVVMFGGYGALALLDDLWSWDGASWSQLAASGGPQPRYVLSMAYDIARDRIVVYGGASGAVTFDDTWELAGTTWSQRSTTPHPSLSATAMAYDPVRQNIVLFGSQTSSSVKETWTWNGTTWTLKTPAVSPQGFVRMTFDPVRGVVVAFDETNAATWEWNGAAWQLQPMTASPPVQSSREIAFDTQQQRVVVFGGLDNNVPSSELWERSPATKWILAVPELAPVPNFGASVAYDTRRAEIVLFGGASPAFPFTWTWDGSSWAFRGGLGPDARDSAALAYDPARDRTVLYGGGIVQARTDTWEWDGASWSVRTTSPSPTAAGDDRKVVMAYDAARRRLVLVNGACETWTWDGTVWAPIATLAAPADCTRTLGLAFDAARGRLVLFTLAADHAETWEWATDRWALAAATGPMRTGTRLAYNATRHRVVMFGGLEATTNELTNDLFEWTGSAWELRSPWTRPPVRYDTTLAFDDQRGKLLIVGGRGSSYTRGDTWTYSFESKTPPEACRAGEDSDADGLSGCADPDCWARCTPACPPAATCDPAAPRCGDGTCSMVEDHAVCPSDCP